MEISFFFSCFIQKAVWRWERRGLLAENENSFSRETISRRYVLHGCDVTQKFWYCIFMIEFISCCCQIETFFTIRGSPIPSECSILFSQNCLPVCSSMPTSSRDTRRKAEKLHNMMTIYCVVMEYGNHYNTVIWFAEDRNGGVYLHQRIFVSTSFSTNRLWSANAATRKHLKSQNQIPIRNL